jgi:hypothetical protein
MAAIDPNQIPGEDPKLDPDAVEAAARALRAEAEAIRESGDEVAGAWSGLRADYEAPEAEQLLRAMDPVRSTTTDFGDDLGRVAAALMTFAAELREIKAKFDSVRADAFAFKDRIRSNPEWEFDQALIDENTALLGRVNSTQVQLWDAERECANAIRAIDDIKRWHSGVAEGDQYGYGLPSIPAGTEMPWGAPVDKKEHCPMSAAMAVKSAVWDGMGHDVIVSTFEGLGGLIGLGEDGFTMETFTATWGGMGMLIGRDPADGEWSWGNAGDAWLETGKSLVAWDMWAEDPARALGTTVLNVGLTVASFGTGAAIKGVATAGKTGQVLAVTGQALRVLGKAMDPVELATGGARLLKGAPVSELLEIGRFSEILRTPLNGINGIDFGPLTEVDVDLGLPESGGVDVPPATGNQLSGEHAPVASANVNPGVKVDAPPVTVGADDGSQGLPRERVREPEMAMAGAAVRNLDDVAGAATRETGGAGQAGSHVSYDQPHGGGDSSSGGSGSGGSGGGGHGSGGSGGDWSGGGGDGFGGSGDGVPGDGGTDGDGGDPPLDWDADGNLRGLDRGLPDSQIGDLARKDMDSAFHGFGEQSLHRLLDERGLSEAEFRDMATKHVRDMTRTELETVLDVRRALPEVTPDTILQKIVNPDVVRRIVQDLEGRLPDQLRELSDPSSTKYDYLSPQQRAVLSERLSGRMEELRQADPATFVGDVNPNDPTTIGGSVSRTVDEHPFRVVDLVDDLGLTYPKTPFSTGMDAVYAVEFPANELLPGTADFVADAVLENFDELETLKGDRPAYDQRVKDLVVERFDTETAPDLLKNGNRPETVERMRDELARRAGYALDDFTRKNEHGVEEPVNPFRGNGFAGQGEAYSPEMLVLGREPIPGGAEFWRLGADGRRELVARYLGTNGKWELAL